MTPGDLVAQQAEALGCWPSDVAALASSSPCTDAVDYWTAPNKYTHQYPHYVPLPPFATLLGLGSKNHDTGQCKCCSPRLRKELQAMCKEFKQQRALFVQKHKLASAGQAAAAYQRRTLQRQQASSIPPLEDWRMCVDPVRIHASQRCDSHSYR